MSILRWKKATDANQKMLISYLHQRGATVEVISLPVDLLVGWKGKWALVEVKTLEGRLAPGQKDNFVRWRKQRLPAFVIRSLDDAKDVLALMEAPE